MEVASSLEFLGVNEDWQLMSPRQIEMSTLVFMLLGVQQSLPEKNEQTERTKSWRCSQQVIFDGVWLHVSTKWKDSM